MLNIINSPIGEARVGSGNGTIDSLHLHSYRGGEKAGAAAKGKDVDRRSIACERAGQLHGPYTNQPGLAHSARPDGFSKL